jgi:hypothetical protein
MNAKKQFAPTPDHAKNPKALASKMWRLATRAEKGKATPEELAALDRYAQANPKARKIREALHAARKPSAQKMAEAFLGAPESKPGPSGDELGDPTPAASPADDEPSGPAGGGPPPIDMSDDPTSSGPDAQDVIYAAELAAKKRALAEKLADGAVMVLAVKLPAFCAQAGVPCVPGWVYQACRPFYVHVAETLIPDDAPDVDPKVVVGLTAAPQLLAAAVAFMRLRRAAQATAVPELGQVDATPPADGPQASPAPTAPKVPPPEPTVTRFGALKTDQTPKVEDGGKVDRVKFRTLS